MNLKTVTFYFYLFLAQRPNFLAKFIVEYCDVCLLIALCLDGELINAAACKCWAHVAAEKRETLKLNIVSEESSSVD